VVSARAADGLGGRALALITSVYSLLMHALRVLAWPVLWWLGRKVPAYRQRWAERRGHVNLPAAARAGVVIHGASMGEVMAALPLVQALQAERAHLPVVVTCTTPTGSALIRERLGPAMHHCYLPIDTPGAARRFIATVQPQCLVLLETELWPNLLQAAQDAGVRVVLANGRLSARSAQRYGKLKTLTQAALCNLDLLLVQDDAVRDRFVALGAAPARTLVTGSLKYDTPLPATHNATLARFRTLVAGRRVWVAASTHEGEEAQVLQAHRSVLAHHPDVLLVIVPRHPQRFDAVAEEVQRQGLSLVRRSAERPVDASTQVLLGDSMGELSAWLALAEFVFMGGSLVAVGGHNPLEAMQFGAPLASGPATFNFAQAFAALKDAQAFTEVSDATSLANAVQQALFDDVPAARQRGARGQQVHAREAGATQRTLAPLCSLLDRHAPRLKNDNVWVDPQVLPEPTTAYFQTATWQAQQAATPHAAGRNTVWFVRTARHEMVLRHYWRGGLMGKLVKDKFLREPLPRSRAMAEYALLQRLRAWGLPVPRPCGARWQAAGPLHYRADILVERIPGAQALSAHLTSAPLSATQWQAVGAAIAQLHQAGVFHSDLNCHNLLIDRDDRVWIIDFDKCAVRARGPWQQANLDRLLRSLRKEQGLQPKPAWLWAETDWPVLAQAYHSACLQPVGAT
jgi:3-deoxy-D-manno-octulosonic-acid transferase